jgi:hypothetical protein
LWLSGGYHKKEYLKAERKTTIAALQKKETGTPEVPVWLLLMVSL